MAAGVRLVGLGGSLRLGSTSLSALQAALDGAASSTRVDTQFIALNGFELALYTPQHGVPDNARFLVDSVAACAR